MPIDLGKIRAETPGVQHVNHLLACGSALPSQPVVDAVIDHLQLEAQIGGYEAHAARKGALEAVYQDVADLLNAEAGEIALLDNATAAWCQIFYGMPFRAGDRVLTCEAEYSANALAFQQRAKRDGIVIDVVPSDATGAVDLRALESMITPRTALIAITWVPTNGGLVNPAADIGKIARAHGVPYLLDACQAVGQMPVDVAALGCDFLSATGRKFLRGPRGTGFLYIRQGLIADFEPPMVDLFSAHRISETEYGLRVDARRFENWENAYALRAGLGVAVRAALEIGLENIQTAAWGLANDLRDGLRAIKGAEIRDLGANPSAIVSFTIDGMDPDQTVAALARQGICIGASSPASTPVDAQKRDLPTVLRAAPHYYNSPAEIAQLLQALEALR